MGLFDFLKNKPADTPATPPPATPNATPAPADKPAGGPRYQGAKFTAPVEPEPVVPTYQVPEPQPLPFEPENVLEQLLLLAATQEEARPAFYQALLQEEILMILAPMEGIEPGEVTLAEGQEIQLQVLSDGKLPIFSSPPRLTDGGIDNGPVSYVRIPGHAFFNMIQGQDCVLNPFSPAGKILPKDELAALLAGQLTGPLSPAGGDAQVLLSQPAEMPEGVIEAVTAWAATQPHIEAAYLAQMQVATNPDVPRLLLAFISSTPDPSFMQELGPVLEGKTNAYQFIDLMLLNPESEEGVNPYFRTIAPFYLFGQ
ncbi:enhanced serine sensitivity protein SseB C-terminal domain-containing protein [Hymenobacter sp. DH14]|uniref:Enhanced serine sensitivity protein SseB C-terminal domain-containing protein n=1 Tax=Hymenobacter cyanobacteriorum TaxID=2926463 RepID=A0A9X2AH88_9BACT|nr:enhanced serine sensitivity protein SseB C-terminal domain-containing protein [Hymenobacter cyanobacteriorum]MCI1187210.1 enhanced serine sensitivity protein SseB C-terminal domain-containing protein [Hymenobacter cyanobacteriorum]